MGGWGQFLCAMYVQRVYLRKSKKCFWRVQHSLTLAESKAGSDIIHHECMICCKLPVYQISYTSRLRQGSALRRRTCKSRTNVCFVSTGCMHEPRVWLNGVQAPAKALSQRWHACCLSTTCFVYIWNTSGMLSTSAHLCRTGRSEWRERTSKGVTSKFCVSQIASSVSTTAHPKRGSRERALSVHTTVEDLLSSEVNFLCETFDCVGKAGVFIAVSALITQATARPFQHTFSCW